MEVLGQQTEEGLAVCLGSHVQQQKVSLAACSREENICGRQAEAAVVVAAPGSLTVSFDLLRLKLSFCLLDLP